jgi:hypothetical protein
VHVDGALFYEGEMSGGEFHGDGRMLDSEYQYEGEFSRGKRNGMGQLRYENKKYTGSFSDDRPHGNGKLAVDTNSGIVEVVSGSFAGGRPHGECTLTDSHDGKWHVTFDDGVVIEKITTQEKETRNLKAEVDRLNRVVSEMEVCYCIICHSSRANTAPPECGHVCMCVNCEQRVSPKVCPFCRTRYRKAVSLRYVT